VRLAALADYEARHPACPGFGAALSAFKVPHANLLAWQHAQHPAAISLQLERTPYTKRLRNNLEYKHKRPREALN
jgi:hypothetical protein